MNRLKGSSLTLELIGELKSIKAGEGSDKAVSENLRKYVIETTTYNFSVNISSNLANALAMRYLGFDIISLGVLTSLRTLSVGLGSLVGLPLIYRFRSRRLLLWLVFGSINRVGWALLIFSVLLPSPWSFIYLIVVVAVVQVSGSIAGLASADTLADMVKPSIATRFFGSVSSLNNLASLLALTLTLVAFKFYDVNAAYRLLYFIALISAIISTVALASIRDEGRPRGDEVPIWGISSLTSLIRKYKGVAVDSIYSRRYVAIASAFTFAVNIPGALWDYYIMAVLRGGETLITFRNIASLLFKALALKLWSPLIERFGAKRGLIVSLISTSPIPVMYSHAIDVKDLVSVSLYSSMAWAPWDIATTLYNYYLTPEDKRPALISLQNITSNAIASIASSLGAWMASTTGIPAVFLTSTMLRSAVAVTSVKALPELKLKN